MTQKITLDYLKSLDACAAGVRWWKTLKTTDLKMIMEASLASNEMDIIGYGSWLICRVFTHEQKVRYAVFAARQVLDLFEKKYPEDLRPRKAIEAAEGWLENPSKANAQAAKATSEASCAASEATSAAAYAAAYAASCAASCAADYGAYYAAVYAANAAANAADYAASSAASYAANAAMKSKILRYGMSLIFEEELR